MTIGQVIMYLEPVFDEKGRRIRRRHGRRIQKMSMAEAREHVRGGRSEPTDAAKARARAKAIEMGKALAAKRKK